MMTCRDCPHIALEQWPQGKTAVRCFCVGNGRYFGRVLGVTSAGNPYPDRIPTPAWCGKRRKEAAGEDNPSVSLTDDSYPYTGEALKGTPFTQGSLNKEGDIR